MSLQHHALNIYVAYEEVVMVSVTTYNLTLLAAQYGVLDVVRESFSSGSFKPLVGKIGAAASNNLLVLAAAAGGHLDVVKWLVQKSGAPIDLTAQHQRALTFAVESGNYRLVRWMILDSGQKLDVTADDCLAEKIARKLGFSKIAKFLSTVAELIFTGLSLNRLQHAPVIVDVVQSGKIPAAYCSWLQDEDIKHIHRTEQIAKKGLRIS